MGFMLVKSSLARACGPAECLLTTDTTAKHGTELSRTADDALVGFWFQKRDPTSSAGSEREAVQIGTRSQKPQTGCAWLGGVGCFPIPNISRFCDLDLCSYHQDVCCYIFFTNVLKVWPPG